ncbi:MAG: TonB-dependent receptor [Cytophagales bacterium]|nr:TonB-dependent receptor [Cytophagales bacterium]
MLLCLLFTIPQAVAQKAVVSGSVKDAGGVAMPAVNVLIKGTLTGVTTDASGNFSIQASAQDVLVFSFIGYSSQEILVGNKTTFTITLEEDVTALQEIVVVGYGTQKKSDLTAAISSVGGETLRNSVTTSIDQALQGRVSGVQVTQNSGAPGGAVSIRIRGTTSLTQSSEPLYVIDGVQVGGRAQGIAGFDWAGGTGGQQAAASNPMASLNPADIESFEVLKDAAATAIYGSRAANGVIIITTKRGKKGEAKVSYNGFYAVQEVYKTFDMMDLPTYAAYNNEVAQEVSTIAANPNFADPSLLGRGTDWQDAVFRVAPMQNHNITIAGGTEGTQYTVSGGFFKQDGIIIGSDFDRFTLRANIDSKVKEGIKIGSSIALSRKNERMISSDGGDGVIAQAAQMAPHIPVRNFDGSFAGPEQQNVSSQVSFNPVGLALLRNNTLLNNRVMTNLFADVQIIKNLSFRTDLGIDYSNSMNKAFMPTFQWGTLVNNTSQFAQRADQNFYYNWTNSLRYARTVGRHDFAVQLFAEAIKSEWEGFTAYKVGLPNDIPVMNQGEISNIPNGGYKGWNTLVSQFTRVNYVFDDRYSFEATLRRDGSSRFGPNNRWGFFPSVSAAWNITKEDFFSSINTNTLTSMKLRASWGNVGNQEIRNYAFGSALNSFNSYFGPAAINSAYSNPDIKWESTEMVNIGLDAELFSGRLQLAFEAYQKKTNNLLLQVNLPAIFGDQVAGPMANVGSMTNKGLELTITTVNIDKAKLRWTTNANISINRNRVTDMGGNAIYNNIYWYSGFQTAIMTRAGYPVGQFFGYVMDGIFTSQEEILAHAVQIPSDNNPNVNKIERTTGLWLGDIKWKDLNGDGKITSEDQTVIGNPNPDFEFGFDNTFSYGPFTLNVFFTGVVGGDVLNFSRTRNEQMIGNFDNQSMTVLNRARVQLKPGGTNINSIEDIELVNPNTTMPRFDNGGENFNHYMSSRWIEDGTYVRLQNVKLSYSLPIALIQKAKIARAQVYANIQNAATFTRYTGLDPQIGAFNQSSLQRNVDMGRYPAPRVYTLGVNIDF